jgi:hypothetical protein
MAVVDSVWDIVVNDGADGDDGIPPMILCLDDAVLLVYKWGCGVLGGVAAPTTPT